MERIKHYVHSALDRLMRRMDVMPAVYSEWRNCVVMEKFLFYADQTNCVLLVTNILDIRLLPKRYKNSQKPK